MIDLHSHTTASDGQHSPAELFEVARANGVTVLAVTDHDTVAGLETCAQAASAVGVTLVPGIELSVTLNRREVHILGHFIDSKNQRLVGLAEELRLERTRRMEQMVERMCGLGFPIRMEQVRALAQDANLGRPHLARVLVELNYCRDTKEAFDRFLKDGGPAWVDRYRLSTREAIELIHEAHGTATVAHPGVSRVERHELVALKEEGLDGLEVFHSDHAPNVRQKFLKICSDLDLVPTAGSDFHGEKIAPDRHLGTASMSPASFEALRKRSATYATTSVSG